jgi:ribonuclease H2 subunit C
VKVPEGYEGVVLLKTEKVLPAQKLKAPEMDGDEDMQEEGEEEAEVKMMEEMGKFGEVVVWGHEVVPEKEDEYVKGVEEWIGFAEAVGILHPPSQCVAAC